MSDNKNLEYKIALLGGGGVGKSALTIRLVTDNFLDEYDPTIGPSLYAFTSDFGDLRPSGFLTCMRANRIPGYDDLCCCAPVVSEDSYRKQVMIDDEAALLDILDTAGQEEFNSMQDQWMRDSKGFLLVYNITSRPTFEEVSVLHDKILRTKDADKVPMVLVGNKCDLTTERQVETSEGAALAQKFGCAFFETSARNKINNEICFFELVREIRKLNAASGASSGSKAGKPKEKKKSKCVIL